MFASEVEETRFGDFTFVLGEGLSRGGRDVPLRPRTLAVIACLLARPNRVVSRDELLATVWPDVAVTPGILNKSISEIRRALGDDPRNPRFIQTLHGRGFRFLLDPVPRDAGREHPPDDRGAEPDAESSVFEDSPGALAVGRARELALLRGWLASVRGGSRLTAFLTGDMGTGKTRLLRAFSEELEQQGPARVDVAWGQCVWLPSTDEGREPYHPVLDALDRLVRSSEGTRARDVFARCAPSWTPYLPWIFPPEHGHETRPGVAPGRGRTARMVRELCVALDELTAEHPLLLVLEDLHWADDATVALIDMLATRTEASQLLMVLTFRPANAPSDAPISRLHRVLRDRDRIVDVTLGPLGPSGVEEMLRRRFEWQPVPDRLAEVAYEQTGGHPLFVVALCNALARRHAVRVTEAGPVLDAPLEAIPRLAQDALAGLLEHELDALTPEEREMLEVVSVVGDRFSAADVARLGGVPEARAASLCAFLVRRTVLLDEIADAPPRVDGTRYAFAVPALAELLREREAARSHPEAPRALGATALRVVSSEEDGDEDAHLTPPRNRGRE